MNEVNTVVNLGTNRLNFEDKIRKEAKREAPVDFSKLTILGVSRLQNKSTIKGEFNEYEFKQGGYELSDIRKAVRTDSYARLMVDKFTVLTITDGYHFQADKGAKSAKNYVEERLMNMEYAHGILFDEELEIVIRNLYQTSNAFIHIIRDKKASDGRKYVHPITKKKIIPIAAFEAIDLDQFDVTILADEFANRKGYRVKKKNHTLAEYKVEDVIHFKLYPSKLFGNAILPTVIDDIIMLRRLEENMVLQTFQHAIPKLIYKVPAHRPSGPIASDPNVINGKRELESMLSHGGLVTTNECEVEIPTAKGILDMVGPIGYARSRVLAGLHMSQLQIGEGSSSNKATANVIVEDIINQAQYTQKCVSRYVNKFIINRLLMESTKKNIRKKLDKVRLYFDEIDISYATTIANSTANLYTSGLITVDEARDKIGMGRLTPKQKEELVNRMSQAEAEQKAAPANQYEKKFTTGKRSSQNDEITNSEFFDSIDAFTTHIDNFDVNGGVKNKIKNYIEVNRELVLDSALNTGAKSHIKSNLLTDLLSIISMYKEMKENTDSISNEKFDTYINNLLK